MTDLVPLLKSAHYVSVGSYKRSGEVVHCPLWTALSDGAPVVRTYAGTAKARRMARNPRVLVAPCDREGRASADPVPGRVVRLAGAERRRARRSLRRRHGWKVVLCDLVHRPRAGKVVAYRLVPAGHHEVQHTDPEPARSARPLASLDPNSGRVMAGFGVVAVGLSAAVGLLSSRSGPSLLVPGGPAYLPEVLGPTAASVLPVWMTAALVLGVLLPVGLLLRPGLSEGARRALLAYAGLLLVQTAVEATLTRAFFLTLAFLTGTLFTSYRLWQLLTALRSGSVRGDRWVGATLTGGLVFWSANLALVGGLLVSAVPR